MTMTQENHVAELFGDERTDCPYGEAHYGPCDRCGRVEKLGWAHVCQHCWESIDLPDENRRLRDALNRAVNEGRNVLPDATDEQAHVIETWAAAILGGSSA